MTTTNALDILEHTIIDLSTLVNDKDRYHRRHKSLPLSPPFPPQSQPINNCEHRRSLSHNKQQQQQQKLSETGVQKDENKILHPTTEYILNEINNLAGDVKTAESRVEHFRREYSETVYQLETLKRIHHRVLQQLREQQENERIRIAYYQDLLCRQARGEFISPSCYYSTPSIASSKKSKKS